MISDSAARVLGDLCLYRFGGFLYPPQYGPPGSSRNETAAVIDWANRHHLTPAFGFWTGRKSWQNDPSFFPDIYTRLGLRQERQTAALAEMAGLLDAAGLPFAVIKGPTHVPDFSRFAFLRPQCDLDLLFPSRAQAEAAADLFQTSGYRLLSEYGHLPTDHLAPLARSDPGYTWQGDFYDPGVPIVFELHYRLWNPEMEGFTAPGLEAFFERSERHPMPGDSIPALALPDRLAYAALHCLRHLLRGSIKAGHVFEVACFLDRYRERDSFWRGWQSAHPPDLIRLQAFVFALARLWCGCRLSPAVDAQTATLPSAWTTWLSEAGFEPLETGSGPAKEELALHLAMAEPEHRARIAARRLTPTTLPAPVDPVWNETPRPDRMSRYLAHLIARAGRHLGALARLPHLALLTAWMAGLPRDFLRFLAASAIWNLGLFLFVLLYNLHLADRGFREDVIGRIATAMLLGQITGTAPAAWLLNRIGLTGGLLVCFAAMAPVMAWRTLAADLPGLLGSAFLAGMLFALWLVTIAPLVSSLVEERMRPRAFSLFFSIGIAMGIVGGLFGAGLAEVLGGVTGRSPQKTGPLLVAAAITAAALLPVCRMSRIQAPRISGSRWPRGPFFARFFLAITVWNLATGAFNPFFNLVLEKHAGFSVTAIGGVFSISQAVQTLTVLAAPWLFRRIGIVGGITATQVAAGAALVLLARAAGVWSVGLLYVLYMAFQWMSEPGLHSLLMSRTPEQQRPGASAMNYTVLFLCHAIAAALSGEWLAEAGYNAVISFAGLLAIAGGVLFWLLLHSGAPEPVARSSTASIDSE